MLHRHLSLFGLVLFAACAAPSQTGFAPLEGGRSLDVSLRIDSSWPDLAGLDAVRDASAQSERPAVTLDTAVFAVPRGLLESGFDERFAGIAALVVSRDEAARLRDAVRAAIGAGDAEELDASAHTLTEGESGSFQRMEQVAFIEAFHIRAEAGVAIADPEIGVVHDGVWWVLKPTEIEAERCRLRLEMGQTRLDRPIPERLVQVVHGLSPMAIQMPSFVTSRLDLNVDLAADEVLLLGGDALTDEGGQRPLLVFLAPRLTAEG